MKTFDTDAPQTTVKTYPRCMIQHTYHTQTGVYTYGAFRLRRIHHARRHYHVAGAYQQVEADIIVFSRYDRFQFPVRYRNALLVVDCFSKFLWIEPITSRKGPTVVKAMAKIFDRMPISIKNIRSDKEASFKSAQMAEMCNDRDIVQTFTTFLPKGKTPSVVRIFRIV